MLEGQCFLCCISISLDNIQFTFNSPSMANANNMIHITKGKLQELICKNTGSVRESEKGMIREHSPQPHCPRMQDGLMAKITQTSMPVYDLDLFSDYNISEDWKEGKDGGEARLAVYDEERDVVDFEAVREVAYSSPAFVCMGDYDDLVAAVDEFGR